MKLVVVGYWNSPEQLSEWIDPRGLVGAGDDEEQKLLAAYLSAGVFCGGELGYSWCRFCCSEPSEAMGSAMRTDGEWAWPEGLAHYVLRHNLRLPDKFRDHIQSNDYRIPTGLNESELVSAVKDFSFWERWCGEMKRTKDYVPLAYDEEKVRLAKAMSPSNSGRDPLGIL